MHRSSHYFDLRYIVQAYNGRFWETICAFNVLHVADSYARECRRNGGAPSYRVLTRNNKGQFAEI